MSIADSTKVLILMTIVLWIAWDVYAYRQAGNIATESWTLKKWSYYAPGIACLLGILLGHFFFSFGTPEQLCPVVQEKVK